MDLVWVERSQGPWLTLAPFSKGIHLIICFCKLRKEGITMADFCDLLFFSSTLLLPHLPLHVLEVELKFGFTVLCLCDSQSLGL